MVKKIIAVTLCAVLWSHADWLDNLAETTTKSGFFSKKYQLNNTKARSILEKRLHEDREEIARIEKLLNIQKQDIKDKARDLGYGAQLQVAKLELAYHEKVYAAIKDLADNKRDREKFVLSLVDLKNSNAELEALKHNVKKVTKAELAAKEALLESKKALIKASFIV